MQRAIATDPPAWKGPPQSADEWSAVIQEANRVTTAKLRGLADVLKVRWENVVISGVPCHRVIPAEIAAGHEKRLLVHTHGGAYVFGGGEAGLPEAALVAHFSKSPVLSIDYRMPPTYPSPAAVEDVVVVWRTMLEGHDPANAAMLGSSAGAGLTMAVTLRLKQLGIPLPAALFLGSPWANIDKHADSLYANEGADNVLVGYDRILGAAAGIYAPPGMPLSDPSLSPLEGDLSGFPPSIILSGTRDLFLSLAALTHRKLRQAGVDAQLHVFEALSHVQYLEAGTSECADAMTEVARFFELHLAGHAA